MTCKKIKTPKGSKLEIYSDRKEELCVGNVVSNFVGTHFTIYEISQERKATEIAQVEYEANLFGYKGPRKMHLKLPFVDKDGKRRMDLDPGLRLSNKQPQWNEETESFVLNFNGRVTMASVKNFQIVSDYDLDYICMQFGRVGSDSFTMDVQYPFSPLQSFGIALTSLDPKLACE